MAKTKRTQAGEAGKTGDAEASANPSKRKGKGKDRGQDRHKQPRLVFHLPQPLYDAFKAHVASLRPETAESAVLRLALERYLASVGVVAPQQPDQGAGS